MTSKHFAMAALAALLMSSSGVAQNASDLLQKGLHLCRKPPAMWTAPSGFSGR